MCAGTCSSASRVEATTSGSASSDIIAPAVRNELPDTDPPAEVCERKASAGRANSARPNIASSTLGRPRSSPRSTPPAGQARRRGYSESSRHPHAHWRGDRDADRAHHQRALDRVETPAGDRLTLRGARVFDSRLGPQYDTPFTNMNSTIAPAVAQRPIPTTQQCRLATRSASGQLRIASVALRGGGVAGGGGGGEGLGCACHRRLCPAARADRRAGRGESWMRGCCNARCLPARAGHQALFVGPSLCSRPDPVALHRLLRGPARERQQPAGHEQHGRHRVQRVFKRHRRGSM